MSPNRWGTFRNPGHRLAVTAFRTGERLGKGADRFLRPYRLSLAQFNLLAELAAHPEGLAQSAIGTFLVVSRANVTGLVGRMARRGLCRTKAVPGDRRVKIVRATGAGLRLLRSIERPYFREIDRFTRGLKAAEKMRLSAALDGLLASMP